MSGTELGLTLSVFLACTVEAVEALTIVLAVGTTRGWASTMSGVGTAVLVLGAIVAVLGPALTMLPIGVLRTAVGGLLLIFGLQWLRKAILRSAGLKTKHDERQIYRQELDAAREADVSSPGFDGYAFAVAFKGVLLEGLEVAFIVLTFGANQHRVALAAVAAGLAVLLVTAAGLAARAPLARVPENTMKFAVGVMLSSFGMFWAGEGVGASWPAGELALLLIVCGVLIVAVAITRRASVVMYAALPAQEPHTRHTEASSPGSSRRARLVTPRLLSVWGFVVGEDWRTAVGVGLALALTAILGEAVGSAWWAMAPAVLGLLGLSILRAVRDDPRTRSRPTP
jgi:uncharacterized membrane protein